MIGRSRVFTVQEFIDQLRRDEITTPLTVTGMVKVSEDSQTELMFAPGTRCLDWLLVPVASVESVEVLDVVPCDDHTHPLVTLTLKAPESSEGAMFAALLSASVKQRVSNRPVRPLHSLDPPPVRVRFMTDKSAVTDKLGVFRAAGGCAQACNEYEIFDDLGILQLYSCQDYGPGIYACYYM